MTIFFFVFSPPLKHCRCITRPSSIFFSVGIVRDIVPPVIESPAFSQTSHFSRLFVFAWIRLWRKTEFLLLYDLPQISHAYSLSSECLCSTWTLSCCVVFVWKSHRLHLCGFNPKCTLLRWPVSDALFLVEKEHIWHWCTMPEWYVFFMLAKGRFALKGFIALVGCVFVFV